MKRIFRTLLLMLVFGYQLSPVAGVIAYPYPVEIKQPDGSRITIIPKGDEYLKWAETLDGYTILRNKSGIYEYAILDDRNDLVLSGIQVRDQATRSLTDNQFLTKLRKGLSFSDNQIEIVMKLKEGLDARQEKEKAFPTMGDRKLVCILVGFTDLAFTKTKADIENLFNQTGYNYDGASGSVNDYYRENSYNQLNLTVTVSGPYTASQTMSYYGANDSYGDDLRPRSLVTEAVTMADPDVNFSDFDNDNDGKVDGVYIIYAGYGEEAGASADAIWAHAWSITPLTYDGKVISKYSCSSELRGVNGSGITRIGVICHEFGHVLGASDYYDTDYNTNGKYTGTGYWDLMGSGSWNNEGATPAHHNPYTKITSYKWTEANILNSASAAKIIVNNAVDYPNSFFRLNTVTQNEYFLLENRQQYKFDKNIPGHGLIIYHVDGNYISVAGNRINSGSHQGMYPVCASASGNPPDTYGSINSTGLPYPGSGLKTSFTDATTPASLSWSKESTNFPVRNIMESVESKTITFDFLDSNDPLGFRALAKDQSSINLEWQKNTNGNEVIIAYNASNAIGTPVNGVAYSVGNSIPGGGTVIYIGDEESFLHTSLSKSKTYYYKIWTLLNSSSYSAGVMTSGIIPASLPFAEDFKVSSLPSGWKTQNISTECWGISNSSKAGGLSYEAKCSYMNYGPWPNTFTRLITPPINTVGENALIVKFNYLFDAYGPGATLKLQTSVDKLNWTDEDWNMSSTQNIIIGPGQISTILKNNLNSETTYIAFVIDGDLFQFDYWYIDNITITSSKPDVVTSSVSTLSPTSVSTGGSVAAEGEYEILERGVCWGNDENPTVILETKTRDGAGPGVFKSTISGLSPGLTYYVRAYASNSGGTGYGKAIQFSVGTIGKPVISTAGISQITSNSATSGGIFSFDGGATVTAKGVCWGTNNNPTVENDSKTTDGIGTGDFVSSITGLLPETKYFVRSYAVNSGGVGYGPEISFTTLSPVFIMNDDPVVSCSGNFYDSGGATGLYSNSENFTKTFYPVSSTNKISCAFNYFNTESGYDFLYVYDGPNTSSPQISGSPFSGSYSIGTIKASDTNTSGALTFRFDSDSTANGQGWDATVSCITLKTKPLVTTTEVSLVTATSAVSGGTVTDDGNSEVTARGVCWSPYSNPTVSLSTKTSDGSGKGTFISTITGLNPGALYHVRAYSTNSSGTSYGEDIQFTTASLPVVSTSSVSELRRNEATGGGNISSDGGERITERGICWSTSINPTVLLSTKTSDGQDKGVFISKLTGLTAGMTYYVRAYAVNSAGVVYGQNVIFSTCSSNQNPSVTSESIAEVTTVSALAKGKISSSGCSAVTSRGFCWSTSINPTVALSTKMIEGAGEGSFSGTITGLSPGISYYVRAFATNETGTAYGANLTFTACQSVSPPVVSTNGISAVTAKSAACSANIVSSGCGTITARGVCWSTLMNPTVDLSTKTVEGPGYGSFTSEIKELSEGVTYHVRAYATNSAGTSYGEDIQFTTAPAPPQLGPLTNVQKNSFTAGWSSSVSATGYRIDVSTNINFTSNLYSYNNKDVGSQLSIIVTGLSSNSIYYVRIRAYNSFGTSLNSNTAVVSTLPEVPSRPTAYSAKSITRTGFTASWSISSGATGYYLDLSTNSSFSTFVPDYENREIRGETYLKVTGLKENTTYYYRVRAYNLGGTSSNSYYISLKTLIPPLTPVALSAANVTQTGFTAKWNSVSGCIGYILDIASDQMFTTFVQGYLNKDIGNYTSFAVTGLSAKTPYYYRVKAYNKGGSSSESNSIFITTLAEIPPAPVASPGSQINSSGFTANWVLIESAAGYKIDVSSSNTFSSFVPGYNNKDIGNVSSTSVTGLNAKYQYFYRIRAYNSGGTGLNSNTVAVTTFSVPPAAPSILSSLSCNNLVTLKWRKNNDPYVDHYRIYYGLEEYPDIAVDSAMNGPSDTIRVISGLRKGSKYYFRIKAVNSDGPESSFSNQVSSLIKTGIIPWIKVKWGDVILCSNLGDSIVTYQWYKDDYPISNALGQYYVSNKNTGSYKVETTDYDGCINASNVVAIPSGTKMSLYPNPASTEFTIKLSDVSGKAALISIYAATGTKVREYSIHNFQGDILKNISVDKMDEGFYLIKITLDTGEIFFDKVIVAK